MLADSIAGAELAAPATEPLKNHAGAIRKRHVARKAPANWFRTIDRVYPRLVGAPKLLIRNIAGAAEVAFDPGRF